MLYLSRMDTENFEKQVIGSYEKVMGEIEEVDVSFLTRWRLGLDIEYHRLPENENIMGKTAFCEIGVEVYREYGMHLQVARLCPYCGHRIEVLLRGQHGAKMSKCPRCGEEVFFPPISFRIAQSIQTIIE